MAPMFMMVLSEMLCQTYFTIISSRRLDNLITICSDRFQVKSKSRRKARNDESSEESSSEEDEGGRRRPPSKKSRRYVTYNNWLERPSCSLTYIFYSEITCDEEFAYGR